MEGNDYIGLGIRVKSALKPVHDEESWHSIVGIMLVEAATLEVRAWWIINGGWSPPRVVVQAAGHRFEHYVPAPDGPFATEWVYIPAYLPPGPYYGVGFGVGKGEGVLGPSEWGGSIGVRGDHSCEPIGDGELFDIDHTEFTGGTQVYAPPGVGYASGISHSFSTSRNLVVGVINAGVIGPAVGRHMSLDYSTPTRSGNVSNDLIPFASGAGTYSFRASYQGIYPEIAIAGVKVSV